MESHEETKPSLHTGYIKMAKVAGRSDLKMRKNLWSDKQSDKLMYDPDKVRTG
jgi:hypothetical protein